MTKDNNDFRDYFRVVWKRKWLIIIPTFFCVVVTAVLSLIAPRKWEIDCIIKPSKFFIESYSGAFQEIMVIDSQQISELINNNTYDRIIADELAVELEKFPELRAKELKETKLIRISLRESDVRRGKAILASLFKHLKRELDEKIELEAKGLENLIANNEHLIHQKELSIKDKLSGIKIIENDIRLQRIDIKEKERQKLEKKEEIISVGNLLKISQQREKNVLSELKEVKKRIEVIDKQQAEVISKEKTDESTLSLLLYSNEIQQNLQYYNTLDKELLSERINQEDLRLRVKIKEGEIKNLESQIDQTKTIIDNLKTQINDQKNDIEKIRSEIENVQNTIALLEERRSRIDYSQLVKEPTSSFHPVSPKRRLNVLIAFILGMSVFVLLAFIIEYTQPQDA